MRNPNQGSPKTQNRKNALNEEQVLCNEAVASAEYDSVTDDQWVAMCEQAAVKGRRPPLVVPPAASEAAID